MYLCDICVLKYVLFWKNTASGEIKRLIGKNVYCFLRNFAHLKKEEEEIFPQLSENYSWQVKLTVNIVLLISFDFLQNVVYILHYISPHKCNINKNFNVLKMII